MSTPPPPPLPPSEPSLPPEFPPEMRRALESLNNPATMRNAEQLETAGLTLMQAATDWVKAHPSPDQDLEDRLNRHTEAMDWPAALETLRQLIARATARDEPHGVFRWQRNASDLLACLHEPASAQAAARAATEAARRVDGMPILVAMALQHEARLNLQRGEARPALAQVTEALDHLGTRTATRLERARALVLRARCRVDLDDLLGAEADLTEAWPMLKPFGESPVLAGAHGGLAQWHETQARLHRAWGEFTLAVQSQETAVRERALIFHMPHVERHLSGNALARALLRLAADQAELGELAAAERSREEGRRIRRELKLPC